MRILFSIVMSFAAICFTLISFFLIKESMKSPEPLVVLSLGILLATLAYISGTFSIRSFKKKKTEYGTYISPYAVLFISLILIVPPLTSLIDGDRSKGVIKGIYISLFILSSSIAMIIKQRKSKKDKA